MDTHKSVRGLIDQGAQLRRRWDTMNLHQRRSVVAAILDHVWGYDASPASNVVDIYIHYLRDKIDRGHPRKLIQTVRSVGYVLRP